MNTQPVRDASYWEQLRERRRSDNERRQQKQERYAQRFPGWRLSKSFYRCPRQVVGKRCLRHNYGRECICESFEVGGRLLDHGLLWVTGTGEYVLTGEPYEINEGALRKFRRECADLGATVRVEDYSPYFPGQTKLVLVEKKRQGWPGGTQ